MKNFIDVRNHLKKFTITSEIPSEWTVICPQCGGRLRISKEKGAMLCVDGYCDPRDVFKTVNINSDDFKPRDRFPVSLNEILFPENFTLLRDENYISEVSYTKSYNKKYSQECLISYYPYNKTHRLYRLDLLESKSKIPIPNYYDNGWKIGNDGKFPFFNESRLSKNTRRNFVIVVEGEKTAEIVSKETGYIAITPPCGFGWSYRWLQENVKRLIGKTSGFLIIPDGDKIGFKKALLFQSVAWANFFPCQIVDFSFLYKKEGDDAVDLINYGFDLKRLIEVYICQKLQHLRI